MDPEKGPSSVSIQGEAVAQGKQVPLPKRVLEENFQAVEGRLELHPQPGGAVKNPDDPEATWSTKDEDHKKEWVGYKMQVPETVRTSRRRPGNRHCPR